MPINIPTNLANNVGEKIDVLKAKSRYICGFKGIVDEFEKKEAELLAKVETIVKSIDDAKNNYSSRIRDDVMEWLRQCKSLIEEDHTEITKACCWGLYPNCIWRYRRGKQLAQKTNEIIRLISVAAAFEDVEQHHPFLSREYELFSCKDFIHFESRNLIYKQLLDELEDVDNYMTALCGMMGTGKTSLAVEMGLKLLESKKIDHVIYIDFSQYSDIKDVQKAIADKLGLLFGDENERERPKIRILIILDDVRRVINFEEIGIPSRDNHMNCRVLIISENKRLCTPMGCPRPIQLGLLSEQDSWMLFQKTAHINDRSDIALQKMGQEIAKECEGLPLAITAKCYRLKGEPLQYWEATLLNLRGGPIDFNYDYDVWRSAYEMIGKEAQKLSLILSLFPKGTKVPIEILTRICLGVGIFEDVEKLSDVRRCVLEVKDILIASLLLLEADGGHVQINGLFRKLALSQNLHDIQVIKMSDMNQNAVAKNENTIRYLYCDDLLVRDMDFFLNWFDSPKLEMLLVNIEASDYVEVPETFFKKMARLRVLFLSSNKPQLKLALQLPSSVQLLKSIRSFFLCHWKLGDISILGTLQSLETLDLDNCSIYELPKEITRLEKLRLLSLKLCEIERNNPFEVINGCLSLEELYFKDNKLCTINNLNEVKAVNQSGTFPTLNRYHLQGGEDSISKCVCLPCIDAMISEATFKYLIREAEVLHLKEIKGEWRNLIPDIVPMEDDQGMNDVVDLGLESCSKVECLICINTNHIECTVRSFFSKLVALKLEYMDKLEELWSGHVPFKFLKCLKTLRIKHCRSLKGILLKGELSLCNLKSLEIFYCPMLSSIFQMSTTQSLDVLEELRIWDCSSLTNIITEDNDHKSYGLIFPKLKTLEIKLCQQLQFIPEIVLMEDDQGMKDVVDLSLESCLKVECLINTKYTVRSLFSVLVALKLESMDNLEELCGGHVPSEFLKCLKTLSIKDCRKLKGILLKGELSLCNLKSLEIFDCPMLTSLFQLSTTQSLVVLEELKIWDCSSLTNIISEDNAHNSYDLIFPKLKTLEMKRCQQLQCILPIVFPRGVPLLETIKIGDCHHLKHIFDQYKQEDKDVALGSLELSGTMSDCFNISLESVKRSSPRIGFKAKQQDRDSSISFISNSKSPHPVGSAQCLPKKSPRELIILVVRNLKQLVLSSLDRTKYLFTLSAASSMMLEILKIDSCYHLEHIIDIRDGGDRKNCDVVFPKLKELEVRDCYELECMFGEYPQHHQNYSDIPIHLPSLEKLNLHSLYKFSRLLMRWPPLKEFNLSSCSNFIKNNSISDMMIDLDSRKPVSKTIKDINEIDNLFCTLTNLTIQFQDVYSIFCLDRVQ